MSDRWYYQLVMEEFGPVTVDQLHELQAEGTIAADDLVRREGTEDWIPFSQADFSSTPAVGSDELQDLSELSFTFEDNDPAAVERSHPSRAAAAAHTATATPVDEPPEALFFYQSLGQELGPLPLRELIRLAEEGTIAGSDKVREGENGPWEEASDFPELAAALFTAGTATADTPQVNYTTLKRLGSAAEAAQEQAANTIPKEESGKTEVRADSSPGTSGSKKKKKRRKKKKDALLEEIFEEVFDEDGHVKTPDSSAVSGVAASATAGTASVTPPSDASAEAPPAPSVPEASAAGGFSSPAAMTSAPAPRPSFTPPKKTKSSGGGGFDFDMDGPMPKVLGGVGVLALLIGAIFMGWIPNPLSTSMFIDPESTIKAQLTEIEAVLGPPVDKAKWNAIKDSVKANGQAISDKYAGQPLNPKEELLNKAARTMVMMGVMGVDNEEKFAALVEQLQRQVKEADEAG